ncbi:MAG: hypothetical protein R2845_14770 [Thermomicrobiales bacterium]
MKSPWAIRIPVQPEGTGFAYEKLANQASGYAIVGVAAVVSPGSVKVGLTVSPIARSGRPESKRSWPAQRWTRRP